MVFAKRTGLCGVLAGSKNIEPYKERVSSGKQLTCTYLLNMNVPELPLVYDAKQHGALVLVEPFLGPGVSSNLEQDATQNLWLTSVSFTW